MDRTWKDIPIPERDELLEYYEDDTLSAVYPTLQMSMQLQTLERLLRSHRQYREIYLNHARSELYIPESRSRKWTDFLVLEGDDWIVAGDIEIPDHDALLLKRILQVAQRHNIKNLLINGDLVAHDQAGINDWVSRWRVNELTYEQTTDEMLNILNQFGQHFNRIVILEGNHDDRIARKTAGEVYLGMLIPGDVAQYTRYSYVYIQTSKRGLIKCVHPDNFSKTPIKLGQEYYATEVGPTFDREDPFNTVKKCHFVISHTHIDQSGWSPDSVYEVHAIGTCRDPQKTAYKNKGQGRHHQWSPSFLMIKNGYFHHKHLWGTDWEQELQGPRKEPLVDLLVAV